MTNYTIISKFRNKKAIENLIRNLKSKGKTCFNFCDTPADPNNSNASPEDQMKSFEQQKDFYNNKHHKYVFKKDLQGLKNAKKIIMLLPAGISVHIEAGIAYGLGKPLILIGIPEKAESLYLIFKERYETADDFINSL